MQFGELRVSATSNREGVDFQKLCFEDYLHLRVLEVSRLLGPAAATGVLPGSEQLVTLSPCSPLLYTDSIMRTPNH